MRLFEIKNYFITILMITAFSGCDNSSFKGSAGKKSPNSQDGILQAAIYCDQSEQGSMIQNRVKAPPGKFFIQGEFCPKGFGDLSVLFIVDFSQSNEFPNNFKDQYGVGNDPKVGDSCGRLKAAAAIVNNLKSKMINSDSVDVSVIQFSDEVVDESKVVAADIKSFETHLVPDKFCGTLGLTNYAAGFDGAAAVLSQSKKKNKVVYFITDGKPLVPAIDSNGDFIYMDSEETRKKTDGKRAADDGRQAMTRLRQATSNLTFYSVFLGNQVEDPQEATNYLNELSGSPDNVKIAENADALANEILKFTIPGMAIEKQSLTAKLGDKDLEILKVEPAMDGGNKWVFQTKELSLDQNEAIFSAQARTVSGIPQQIQATLFKP